MPINAPDLTKQPPRSARVRLGGYVILPRMLDKGRATIAGKNGEFHYNCPLDKRFVEYVGIDAEKLKEQLAAGKGDWEILQWIEETAKCKRATHEIMAWSNYQENRVTTDLESRAFFTDYHSKAAAHREDIGTWFELLDLDDFVTYGGKA